MPWGWGIALIVAAAVAPAFPAVAREATLSIGYENPEGTYFQQGTWYVSNLGGLTLDPLEKDGDGFISKIEPGQAVTTRWVTGLHAPKGMRVHNGVLWVADVEQVVAIDLATGRFARTIPIPGAPFLNDVDVDRDTGHVYVTDTFGNKIWRIVRNNAKTFLSSPGLEAPTGILVDEGRLLIASFGPDLDPTTFQTDQPGRILTVDLATRTIEPMSDRIGNLDGIERDGPDLLVSDFWGGQILRVHADGTTEHVMHALPTMADIGWDPGQRVLAVPTMAANTVSFHEL